ncbi:MULTISPECIES: hypothetical protein [unclassified Bradyrhizobium]|uniref:hypothetical protein n=1 Tax=unclassified Bradyrhizobium TaxID=2631580 RepID=UPI00247864A5|nr:MULTISPECIES: hypothetical protein [unclassified Bradyrhizobium]WGR69544.1 hypothetical protein MTX24_29560 [Bradyrhizobium sp. ISRA426]WGR81600.1 hypothetical protein MTX21_14670 [Bradyrhizobium sp. ISRA430]WGR84784.1 hypothetical protein MTX25_29235 [Bradyrhizobium sp. ISRA432]
MKILSALLTAALLLAGIESSHAAVRIADDPGGQIGEYLSRYSELRASGQTVMIDGLCASACTILLSTIPHDKICVTPNATLGFHAAYDFVGNGRTVTNPEATQLLYSGYPSQVRRWITRRGGLTPRMIFLRGKQLQAMYRPCYVDARAPAAMPSHSDLVNQDQRGFFAGYGAPLARVHK